MTKSQNTKSEQQKDLCIISISVDMSTEEAPYNRIYAKPVEKQGDVLLCEFESANYDIEQKELRKENAQLKELLKECSIANTVLVSIMDWLRKSTIPEQREGCEKLFEKAQELQKQLDEALQ